MFSEGLNGSWKGKSIFTIWTSFHILSLYNVKSLLVQSTVCFLRVGKYSSNLKITILSFWGLFYPLPALTTLLLTPHKNPGRTEQWMGRTSSTSPSLGIILGDFTLITSMKTPVFVWNHQSKGPLNWASRLRKLSKISIILHSVDHTDYKTIPQLDSQSQNCVCKWKLHRKFSWVNLYLHKCVRKPPFNIPMSFFCSVKKERGKWQIFQLQRGSSKVAVLWGGDNLATGSGTSEISHEGKGRSSLLEIGWAGGLGSVTWLPPTPDLHSRWHSCHTQGLSTPFSGPSKFKSATMSPDHCPHILPLIRMFG